MSNTVSGAGLNLNGVGAISVLGNLSADSGNLPLSINGSGTVTLSGNNNQLRSLAINGANAVLNLPEGSMTYFNSGDNLYVSQNSVINGPGAMVLYRGSGEDYANNSVANGKTLTVNAKLTGETGFEYWNGSNFGTIALLGQNDFTLNVIMNAAGTLVVTNIGNQASTTSNLGAGSKVIFNSTYGGASCVKYTGLGEDSNRILEFRRAGIIDQSGPSGNLRFTTSPSMSGSQTITLRGSTAGTGEFSANIPGTTRIAKTGTGTWFLSVSNTYSGTTTVDAGNLVVSGINGAVKTTSKLNLNGGAFVLMNSATANHTDRLSDSLNIYLNGGALCFSNDQSEASFSENVGRLFVNTGASSIITTPSVAGQTSTLQITSLTRIDIGTVDFVGEGLGDSDSNRVFITTGQTDGLIGSWATVNGTRYAAYSSTRGVYAAPETVDIAARGYSVITNDATRVVRISYPGESGPITLETSPVTSVGALLQNSETPAIVSTADTLFKLSSLAVPTGKASLTIGTIPREGTLSALAEGGLLSLENSNTGAVLTINASIVPNTLACSLNKVGPCTVLLLGENTYAGPTTVNNGDLVFGSGHHVIGELSLKSGSFFLTNTADTCVYVGTNSAYIGTSGGDLGRIALHGNTAWAGYPYLKSSNQASLVVGQYGRGVLTLQDNASVTQRLYVGSAEGSAGAVYQNGGTMHNWGGVGSEGRIGMSGYGYYELNSGVFTNNGSTQLGRDLQAVGILRQNGGTFQMGNNYDGYLGVSRGGVGVIHLANGLFSTSSQLNLGESADNDTTRGFAAFTVAGGSAEINGSIFMANRESMFATLNLNGGSLAANMIYQSGRPSSLALVNFNGGTLRSRVYGPLFGIGTAAPNAVTLYAGGATLDTSNQTCTVALPLNAPTGNSVTSISVTPRGGYIGPPMVTISGGGGTGATAIAQFDSTSGFVTGIQMTCPGFGYTTAPTVTLADGGTNVQATLGTVSLGTSSGGGLTKIGTGTLTLSATNTYTGTTLVSNGTLFVTHPYSLPANSSLILDGGNLEVGSSLSTVAPIRVLTGVLRLYPSAQPGLNEAALLGSANNFSDWPVTNILTQLTTRMANTNARPPWSENITYVYWGYLWNRAETNVTWTFAENVDDNAFLRIDETVLLLNGGWNTTTTATMTLTPGAHLFEARFGNGGGGAGLVTSGWWQTTTFGFGVDFLGRNETNIANYVALTDLGDGSLLTRNLITSGLTNRLATSSSVELGEAGVLDLGTNTYSQTLLNLSGSGIVSNGLLTVTGSIAPGGTNVIGTLTVANCSSLNGILRVDVASDGTSDKLVIKGGLDLSGLSLEIANPLQLNKSKIYTIATTSGTLTGSFTAITGADSRWTLRYRPDGTVVLVYLHGTLINLR